MEKSFAVVKYWWNTKLQEPWKIVFVVIFQSQVANCDLWIIRNPLGMLLTSPSGFHQSCPSPVFIVLRASVSEGEGSLYPGQQLQWCDTVVNGVVTKDKGSGVVPHYCKWMSGFLQEDCGSLCGKVLLAYVLSLLMKWKIQTFGRNEYYI